MIEPIRSRWLGLILCLPALGGCITHWEPQAGPVPVAVANAGNAELRITRRDGTHVVLEQVRSEGDSLIGRPDTGEPPRLAIPLADVATISQREPDVGASVALGAVATLLAFFLILAGLGPLWSD